MISDFRHGPEFMTEFMNRNSYICFHEHEKFKNSNSDMMLQYSLCS